MIFGEHSFPKRFLRRIKIILGFVKLGREDVDFDFEYSYYQYLAFKLQRVYDCLKDKNRSHCIHNKTELHKLAVALELAKRLSKGPTFQHSERLVDSRYLEIDWDAEVTDEKTGYTMLVWKYESHPDYAKWRKLAVIANKMDHLQTQFYKETLAKYIVKYGCRWWD